jgi:predicted dehydrogenase
MRGDAVRGPAGQPAADRALDPRAVLETKTTRLKDEKGTLAPRAVLEAPSTRKPRLGFLGTGWIGRLRMAALHAAGSADFRTVYDPSPAAAQAAAALQAGTDIVDSYADLLATDIDGVVIATPSALHASQCEQALQGGKAVFCQKPLARTRAETAQTIQAARTADKLLAVDFCYRRLAGMQQLRTMIAGGELGEIFAADLVFHNAYGPDKPWFYDVHAAGGGCVMDLGIHLVDCVLWLLGPREVTQVESQLFRHGRKLSPPYQAVEDYAAATLTVGDTHVRLCCSWNLHAGQDAVIEVRLHGTRGGAAVRNVAGSFFDFNIHRFTGTGRERLAGYPDNWGCRALSHWVDTLATTGRFDPAIEAALPVAEVIDRIYCR